MNTTFTVAGPPNKHDKPRISENRYQHQASFETINKWAKI